MTLMNSQTKTSRTSRRRLQNLLGSAFIALALPCFAVSPAVLAGPRYIDAGGEDRGNNNSAAEGIAALNLSTTGLNNTAHGWYSLTANAEGSDNTANGFSAL